MVNLDLVRLLCSLVDRAVPGRKSADLITFVKDRPGHDRRYAMNIGKIRRELGWAPRESFASGLEKTVRWYLHNIDTHFARSEAA
jgi:dTDP-glucose 4,6-dehydratase